NKNGAAHVTRRSALYLLCVCLERHLEAGQNQSTHQIALCKLAMLLIENVRAVDGDHRTAEECGMPVDARIEERVGLDRTADEGKSVEPVDVPLTQLSAPTVIDATIAQCDGMFLRRCIQRNVFTRSKLRLREE